MSKKRKRKSKGPAKTFGSEDTAVRIYPNRSKHLWQVVYYDGIGKSRQRTVVQFADRKKAWREAQRIEGLLAATANDVERNELVISPADRASFARASELVKPTGVPLELVAVIFAKAFNILKGDRDACDPDDIVEAAKSYARHRHDIVAQKTVPEVVKEFLNVKEGLGKSDRYIGDLRARLNRFAKEKSAGFIENVTTAEVQGWIDGFNTAPQTKKNYRTVLHTLFEFAEARGYIYKDSNPVADTETIDTGEGDIEIYTPEEMFKLLTNAPADFVPVLALGAFAGLRTAEIDRLEWSAIDLPRKYIKIGKGVAKKRSRRVIPILPNLTQWLAPFAGRKGFVWSDNIPNARAETVEAAKVPWKPNALRHSFISYRMAAIQNENQVALEAGNSPGVIHEHYLELVIPEAATAWFAIAPETPENVLPIAAAQAVPVQP